MKKIFSFIMAIVILATLSMTAFAANDLTNSVGSVATDSEAVQVIGNDATQGKVSEYEVAVDGSTATSETNTKSVDVYATQGSTYSVKIPKTIVLDGTTGNAAYRVSVKGNISGNQTVKVIPDSTFVLSEVATANAKSDITAVVTQAKTAWTTSELSDSTWATQNASIAASPMSAGSWHGTFGFTVSIENAA